MKKIIVAFISTFLIVSCGNKKEENIQEVISSKDLQKIRAKKKDIEIKQKELLIQLDSLNNAIAKLDTSKKMPLVTTFVAKNTVFNHYLELQGDVKTMQNVVLYPETPGIIDKIYVKEGQQVSKGTVLAKINDGGLSQQLAQAENQEALAKTTFERQERLWEQKIGSEMQYLQTKTNYLTQKKVVEQLKSQLDKTKIVSPFSGVIDEVFKEEKTAVAPGQGSEVFRIINLSNMYIETEVPERYINNVKKGKGVMVYFPVLGKKIEASVQKVGNYINPTNRSFMAEIPVQNTDKSIKPNLTAKLKINDYTNEKALLVSQDIISENAEGKQYVYVVTNIDVNKIGTAKRVMIETGISQGDFIEVLKGVKFGDEIIQEGARKVKEGQKVQIIKE